LNYIPTILCSYRQRLISFRLSCSTGEWWLIISCSSHSIRYKVSKRSICCQTIYCQRDRKEEGIV